MARVREIDAMAFGTELWSRRDLYNPCISAQALYYMAARYDTDLLDKKKAARYYKIASMHDDAPQATRFLGILASGNSGDHHDAALRFTLLAIDGYDRAPYSCQKLAERMAVDLAKKEEWTPAWLTRIEREEKNLEDIPDNNDPLSLA
jgi:TPR repeat protein